MQLDLSKVLSRSTLTPTLKVCGWSQKGFIFYCGLFYNDQAFGVYNPDHMSQRIKTPKKVTWTPIFPYNEV